MYDFIISTKMTIVDARLLSDSLLKLRNRLVPNGMLGGVGGR